MNVITYSNNKSKARWAVTATKIVNELLPCSSPLPLSSFGPRNLIDILRLFLLSPFSSCFEFFVNSLEFLTSSLEWAVHYSLSPSSGISQFSSAVFRRWLAHGNCHLSSRVAETSTRYHGLFFQGPNQQINYTCIRAYKMALS